MAARVRAKAAPALPVLPPESAGKWMYVTYHDHDFMLRWLNVMRQSDRRYAHEQPIHFNDSIAHMVSARGASCYYWSSEVEIVLRFVFSNLRRQYRLERLGFIGKMDSRDVLNLILDETVEYLREWKSTSTFLAFAKRYINQHVAEVLRLFPEHPRVRIKVEMDKPLAARWNIDFPELKLD